jgi:hypothetical protein
MQLYIEENRGWLRSHTHTLVLESDPDFGAFAQDHDGSIVRWLRIWMQYPGCPADRSYVGCVGLCPQLPSRRELMAVFRRMRASADRAGYPRRELRRSLTQAIRQRLESEPQPRWPVAEPDPGPHRDGREIPAAESMATGSRRALVRLVRWLWPGAGAGAADSSSPLAS